MPALNQTIAMWAGNTLQVTIPVRNADKSAPNLSDASARWWMGDPPSAGTGVVHVRKSTAAGGGLEIVRTSDSLGECWGLRFTLVPDDTLSVPPGGHYHEAEVTDADGRRSTVTTGPFTLHPTLIR